MKAFRIFSALFYFALILFAMHGCMKKSERLKQIREKCDLVVQADFPKCDSPTAVEEKILRYNDATILYDVCGKKVLYEFGKACKECRAKCSIRGPVKVKLVGPN